MNGRSIRTAPMSLAAFTLLGLAGCATTGTNLPAIPRLEQERAANPNAAPVLRALGIEYYKANRFPEARATLQDAQHIDPGDGVTALYLGLTAEAQNDIPAAREAYTSYLKIGRTKQVRSELQARLALLEQKQLQLDAADALKREAQLDATPGSLTTVAVLPFKFSGSDTTLRPLERGFAELLTTDLSRSPSLTVLERARLQAILDELALQRSGATDSATSVRSGRLIQAGSIVSGGIVQTGTQLNTTAEVLDVRTSGVEGGPSTDNETMDHLFDMEKNIALKLFTTLHVTLTTAQRNAIEQRPTKSLAAFLSYSRGLAAEDEGQFDDASRYFQDAARLDPGFAAAAEKAQEAKAVVTGTQTTAAVVQASLKGSEGAVVSAATQGSTASSTPGGSGAAATAANALNPSPTQAASQSGGTTTTTPVTPATSTTVGAASGTGANNPTAPLSTVPITIPRPPLR